ncbi:hypothetical protein jhhlp_002288 [Lomentospora prolificans]|uniref:Uncharacterized protein n=1 Tax=Lomentospora prolificans TaxID=41688 RepID=A0A2N3NDL1_9PEZI|nr:hypothetical protein jhhlp_002288 [Lomentospora prolificans]
MAPAVDSPNSFHRSSSSSELLSLPRTDLSQKQRNLHCKSLPSVPFEIPSFDSGLDIDTRLSLDTDALTLVINKGREQKPSAIVTSGVPAVANIEGRPKLGRSNTVSERTRSWLPSARSATNIRDFLTSRTSTPSADERPCDLRRATQAVERREFNRPTRSMSESFPADQRRSWVIDSPIDSPRSSPEPLEMPTLTPTLTRDKGSRKGYSRVPKPSNKNPEETRVTEPTKTTSRAFNRASIFFTAKMKTRPSAALGKLPTAVDLDDGCASSSSSIAPATRNTDTPTSQSTSVSDFNSTTDASSLENSTGVFERDSLVATFKNLDLEASKFENNAAPMFERMYAMKSALLVFLHQYTSQGSIKPLHAEDIERRATVLNRWWVALLDLLESLGPHPTPGVDRISLLEALTLIMMRPEWRHTTSVFLPLADRSPNERVRARSWTQGSNISDGSTEAALLTESAEHNIRSMFVANLVRQMDMVVQKMSQRPAPVGLVNFCGKACAYAFFFAPGVADILVRLWTLNPLLLQRVADEYSLPRKSNGESEDIIALFPPAVGSLGWTSVKAMGLALKTTPKMPARLARIPWHSPWIARWRGRDTDLFFIFCKYYHILAEEFMPAGLPLVEKARAPAFVLVHCQILSILDTTIHRQAALQALAMAPPVSDGPHGLDASATAMPTLPADLLKNMSENRLIVLLRDILSDTTPSMSGSRHTFAEAFMADMKASAKLTSQFNYSACHTLCDFLEEALPIYDCTEETENSSRYMDWPFWFQVCKLILESLNTMSEMRVLCLLYTIWDAATRVPLRKEKLCFDLLLSEATFYRLFNHWCPMVRSYFMRLLCWRVCRDDGRANALDRKIFELVSTRLRCVWANYLYLKQEAEDKGRFPPSTAPCYPTPGKKFMIIRSEANTILPNSFAAFDATGKFQSAELPMGHGNLGVDDILQSKSDGKKRWSLLGLNKVLSFKNDSKLSLDDDTSANTLGEKRESVPPTPPKGTSTSSRSSTGSRTPDPLSRSSSPDIKSGPQYVFRFVLNWYPPAAVPPVGRVLSRPRLPSPAQSWINAHSRTNSQPGPIAPGLPAITRRVSGSPQTGLINEARNAMPLETSEPAKSRASISSTLARTTSSLSYPSSPEDSSSEIQSPSLRIDQPSNTTPENIPVRGEYSTDPIRPNGVQAKCAVYSGRALAEWSIVVFECNNFVERRREEGVLGLREVEVPTLTLEGYRHLG